MSESKGRVFVIQPFTKIAAAIFEMISAAAAKAGVSVYRADSIATGASISEAIRDAIQAAPLLIADISDANPNVMFEVGLAQAQQKPVIFVASSSRRIPFDLAAVRIIIYDLADPGEFIDRLTRSIVRALKSPADFTPEGTKLERAKKQSVFISYSHQDRDYLDRLLVHLRPLEKEGLIDLWVDTRLRAGDRWRKEIEKALSRSTVAVLLVSADFLASDFITENELPPLLRDAEEKGTRIIPLIVKPCRFSRDRNLRHFQAMNDPKGSLVLLPSGEQELLYDSISAEIERSLQKG